MGIPINFATIILAGVLVRVCLFPYWGFKQDFNFFSSWAAFTLEHPITQIYDDPTVFDHGLINYPPLYLYVLAALAQLYRFFFEGPLDTRVFLCLIKSTTVLFEIFSAYLIYKFVRVQHGERLGVISAAGYFCNPAILYVSSYYGQVDAIFASFLLASVILLLMGNALFSGCFIAAALLTKIQTVPFLPLVFFILLSQKKWRPLVWQTGGFVVSICILMLPFILAGKAGLVYQRCIAENFAWSSQLSVSAFNIWFLHDDPKTWDYRIWGWLYGSDGMVTANSLILLLTYKKLGLALLGTSFLYALYLVWSRCKKETVLLAFAWVSLAFFMFPTKVHERYLYPFFMFFTILCAYQPNRKWLFRGFTVTYLINLMVICPLIGEIVKPQDFDSTIGVWIAAVNVVLLAAFMQKELPGSLYGECSKWIRVVLVPVAAVIALLCVWHHLSEPPKEPNVLYLSSISPAKPPKQDWPPIPSEFASTPPHLYYQLGRDHSIEKNELRIGDTLYRYGLGAHAVSEVEYIVSGNYTHFESYIGIDHETLPMYTAHPNRATAKFEVWINDEKQYESDLKIPTTPAELVRIRLPYKASLHRIRLVVTNGDGFVFSDHANWALARVIKSFKPAGDRS